MFLVQRVLHHFSGGGENSEHEKSMTVLCGQLVTLDRTAYDYSALLHTSSKQKQLEQNEHGYFHPALICIGHWSLKSEKRDNPKEGGSGAGHRSDRGDDQDTVTTSLDNVTSKTQHPNILLQKFIVLTNYKINRWKSTSRHKFTPTEILRERQHGCFLWEMSAHSI